MKNKIQSFDVVCEQAGTYKKAGKKIVLCYGLFHFLHVGHIRYLKEAKNHGDFVIVSVRADQYIQEDENVQFDENMRAESLASLGCVDAVVINPFEKVAEFINRIRPDIYFEGFESDIQSRADLVQLEQQTALFQKWGVKRVVMKEHDFTSTLQINRYLANLPDDIQNYMALFRQRYESDTLMRVLAAMQDQKILVLGDTIIDDYQFCSAIGKSSKDPTLALKYESHDLFAGGVLAVANHIAGFAEQVDLVTILGEQDSHEDFIRSKLNGRIQPHFHYKAGAPTLIKRRFLDGHSMNKLLEVYVMDDSDLNGKLEKTFYDAISARLPDYDLVISADFGHGTINQNMKQLLSRETSFLAVNAQSNAGNRGFNNITKYPEADYICMAEHEIRLEMRDMTGKIRRMMDRLSRKMKCRKITVTRGLKGCMTLDNEGGFVQVPSFSQKVVDRVGAGDALFAVTAMAAVQDAPCEIVGFLGNVAGSLAIEMMGNQKSVDRQAVSDFITKLYEE